MVTALNLSLCAFLFAEDSSTTISLPQGFDASLCRQEISAEDEEFLAAHLKEIVPSGIIEYDPETGAVRLDYTLGEDVKKDAKVVVKNEKHIRYKLPVVGRDRSRDLSHEEKRNLAPFSFEANTEGTVTFPVPLRCWARADYFLRIRYLDRTNSFRQLVMFKPENNAGYVAEWLGAGVQSGEDPPKLSTKGLPPRFLRSSQEWFNKVREVPMRVEFSLTDPGKKDRDGSTPGVFVVHYDLDGDEAQSNRVAYEKAPHESGYVGFSWSRVRFYISGLVITGLLDKKEAVTLLRKKLDTGKAKEARKE